MIKYFTIKLQLTILILLGSAISATAQFNTDFFTDTTQRFNISAGADYTYGSSVMNTQFLNKFLFGGKIDREMKDNAYSKLNENNRLGGDLNYRVAAEIPFDTLFGKTNLSLLVGVEFKEHVDLSFNENFFKLIFDGNKQFAGQTTYLDVESFNYLKYQKLNVGLAHIKKNDEKIIRKGLLVSLVKGEERQSAYGNGSMTTQQLGTGIDLDLKYNYHSSDTANKGFKAFNGIGFSTTIFSEFYFKNGVKVYMGIEDVGFIVWNKQSLNIRTNNYYNFEGVVIDNIFDINDSLTDKLSKDSLFDLIAQNKEKTSNLMYLPASFNINFTKKLSEKWKVNLGISTRALVNYFPFIYTNAYYYFNPKFSIKTQLAYGGYGKFNVGLALAKSFNNKFDVMIGTNNIEGLLLPNMSYANSGFVGLKKYF